jgi:hypothetical protein
MKTKLPAEIKSVEAAKTFLTILNRNHESFHPEDDAHDIDWTAMDSDTDKPTKEECDLLNKLMDDIYDLPKNTYGRKHIDLGFDPCGFLLYLNGLESLDVVDSDIYISDFVNFKKSLVKAGYKIYKAIKNLKSYMHDPIMMRVSFTCANVEVKKLYMQTCENYNF